MTLEGKSAFFPPRGMRDITPDEMAKMQYVCGRIKKVFSLYGYDLVDPTHLERIETLYAKAGPEVEKEIYSFEDKGGRRLGLRFELTVGIARMVATNPDWPKPLRLASISNVWRYDEPQYGRYRSFLQWDVELFGTKEPAADAEIVEISSRVMDILGLSDYEVLINDREILDAFLGTLGLKAKKAEIMRIMDKRGKISEEEMGEQLKALSIAESDVSKIFEFASLKGDVFDVCDNLRRYSGIEENPAIARMELIGQILEKSMGLDRITFDLSMVRGLDYYTGFIFECYDKEDLGLGSVFGGGRFDGLVGIFGRDCPAVGCAGGISRLIMSLEARGLLPKDTRQVPEAYVIPITKEEIPEAMRAASILRKAGVSAAVEVMGRKLRRSLEAANKAGHRYTIIVGRRDLERGVITVREMESGTEHVVKIEEVAKPIIEGQN